MDKKQAFDILFQATGAVSADRATHMRIQQALEVIRLAIEEKPQEG